MNLIIKLDDGSKVDIDLATRANLIDFSNEQLSETVETEHEKLDYIIKMIEEIAEHKLHCQKDKCEAEKSCSDCALEYVIERIKEQK